LKGLRPGGKKENSNFLSAVLHHCAVVYSASANTGQLSGLAFTKQLISMVLKDWHMACW